MATITHGTSLAVTGATGRLGGRVAKLLAARGEHLRLVVRDPARAPAIVGAADAGVERIVYVSFYGAARDSTFTLGRDHWATEQHLSTKSVKHVLLRDNLYLDFLASLAGEDGVIRGPAGDGRLAAVARGDIADAAVRVLTEPGRHDGQAYHLTGPQSLSLSEVAATLTEHQDRPVTYLDETLEQAYTSRAGYGAPTWQVDAWVSTYTAIAAGELAAVTDDIPRLTGHPATSLAQLLAPLTQRSGWRPVSPSNLSCNDASVGTSTCGPKTP